MNETAKNTKNAKECIADFCLLGVLGDERNALVLAVDHVALGHGVALLAERKAEGFEQRLAFGDAVLIANSAGCFRAHAQIAASRRW